MERAEEIVQICELFKEGWLQRRDLSFAEMIISLEPILLKIKADKGMRLSDEDVATALTLQSTEEES